MFHNLRPIAKFNDFVQIIHNYNVINVDDMITLAVHYILHDRRARYVSSLNFAISFKLLDRL